MRWDRENDRRMPADRADEDGVSRAVSGDSKGRGSSGKGKEEW